MRVFPTQSSSSLTPPFSEATGFLLGFAGLSAVLMLWLLMAVASVTPNWFPDAQARLGEGIESGRLGAVDAGRLFDDSADDDQDSIRLAPISEDSNWTICLLPCFHPLPSCTVLFFASE